MIVGGLLGLGLGLGFFYEEMQWVVVEAAFGYKYSEEYKY
jgi:hypothetical protein